MASQTVRILSKQTVLMKGGIRRVVVAELNDGQLRREIERLVCDGVEIAGVQRLDGELITPQQILDVGGLL